MNSVLQNVKTGQVSVEAIPPPVMRPGNVLVANRFSLVSAGTEKAVMDFSSAGYLKKARMRPDLVRKVLNRVKNEGLLQTYLVINELMEQKIQLGYSCAGVVQAVGSEIDDVRVGQRVACAGMFCATHSELVSVPRNLVVPVPDGLSDESAAFVTLGAIAMQGIRLADLALSENVVVYGLGLVGMVAGQMAVAAGCRVVGLDIDARKIELARGMGIESYAIDEGTQERVLSLTGGYGADKVLLCAATQSNEPIERIPGFTRQKGLLVIVGDVRIDVPRRAYYDREIDIRISRSYGPGRYDRTYEEGGTDYPYAYVRWTENRNMAATLDLAARKRIDLDRLVTHKFTIREALGAYELIQGHGKEPYLGILIEYPGHAAALPPVEAACVKYAAAGAAPVRTSDTIRMGVIGAGNFGKAFLLPAFKRQRGVRFVGVCTASGVSASSVAKRYGMSFATSDADRIFADTSIDAVIVATRHDSHAEYVVRGLESGKALYVEKPLATREDDLERVRHVFEERRAKGERPYLMVGFNRRFSPLARTLKAVFERGGSPLAMMYRVNAGRVPPTEWVHDPVVGGGRVVGEVCHFIDFCTYLAGEPPISVLATPLMRDKRPVRDVVTLSMEFRNGSTATVHYFANGDPSMPKEYIEVFGGGVCAQMVNFRQMRVYGAEAGGKTRYLNQVKGYAEEAAAFVAGLKKGAVMPISFEELYAVTQATFAAEKSMMSGERVPVQSAFGRGGHDRAVDSRGAVR